MIKAIEENKLTVTIKDLYKNSIYIGNLCLQAKIIIRTKRIHHLLSTPVTVFLIAEKLVSIFC